jgi:hypothetical protein
MGRFFSRVVRRVSETWSEIRARRLGRRGLPARPKHSAVREVVGPTGYMWSQGWDRMAEGATAFEKSFDPHLPPSLHISQQERHRFHLAIPVAERCLEDWVVPQAAAGQPSAQIDPEGSEPA